MELSICYSFFLSLISIVFSATGIYALRIATIPVSDMVKDQFENFIVLSLSYSISYTFLVQPALKYVEELKDAPDPITSLERINYVEELKDAPDPIPFLIKCLPDFALAVLGLFILLAGWAFMFFAFIQAFKGNRIFRLLVTFGIACAISFWAKLFSLRYKFPHTIVEELMTGSLFARFYCTLTPLHALCWVLLQCVCVLYVHLNAPMDLYVLGYFYTLSLFSLIIVPDLKEVIAISSTAAYVYEHGRIIEIVCGTLATILAQYYFRIQSVALMFAFLSLATAWLGILANVHPRTDVGIFQFLVAASLQIAVNIFGLHFYTFLVALGAIILMVLRWKMESLDEIILKLLSRWKMEDEIILKMEDEIILKLLSRWKMESLDEIKMEPLDIILKLLSRWKMESVSVRHFRPPV